MTAEELYNKIREKYPDFEPEEAEEYEFNKPITPFLTQKQLELLDNGFRVTPNTIGRSCKRTRQLVTEILSK